MSVLPDTSSSKIGGLHTPDIDSTLIQVDDKVYNATALAQHHPGGELFVKAFSGRDASEAFLSYHRRAFPHDKMKFAYVEDAKNFRDPKNDEDYHELSKRIDQVLPKNETFAPPIYYAKAIGLILISLYLEYYIHSRRAYKWYLTGLLGLFFALMGLNIQHDANHGSISKIAWVNRAFGFTQNWIGGSAIDWIHQHVVQHHIFPNDVENDPDIVGNVILRLNPIRPRGEIHASQHEYVWYLLSVFGVSFIYHTYVHLVNHFHFTKFSKLLQIDTVYEQLTSYLFFFRWIVLPLILSPSISTFFNVLPLMIVGGYYLAFFFIISHNFEGAVFHDHAYAQLNEKSFLRRQILTASNVGGPILCFINGGLNYQIEHHLFPRIQHTHYPLIAPIVRKYCEEKNIPYYHFSTIQENLDSTIRHLKNLGNKDHIDSFKVSNDETKKKFL